MKVAVIGGGASGIMAALMAADNGLKVTLFEKKDRIGKKILATGNGRCNFTNMKMGSGFYYCEDAAFVDEILNKFSNEDLINFFKGLGLLIKDKNNYVYPYSEQASSVLDVLRIALAEKEKAININTESEVIDIKHKNDKYVIKTQGNNTYEFDKVIISTGSKSGLSKKETVNGYDLCKSLGLKISKLYPALTQIKCEGLNFKAISGVRSDCIIKAFDKDTLKMEECGEILFTDYGISGIVSFQISHFIVCALDEKKKIKIIIDLLPGLSVDELKTFLEAKMLLHPDLTLEELFTGIVNKKLVFEILKINNLKPKLLIKDADKDILIKALLNIKELSLTPLCVNDFDSSQVTAGGVLTSELTADLEAKSHKGLFITGELINVDGVCGGYNLQWAFSTGAIAGKAAAL